MLSQASIYAQIDRPEIETTIDIADNSTIRLNTPLIQYGTYDFIINYEQNDSTFVLTNACSALLTCKEYDDALSGSTNIVFECAGVITDGDNGEVTFPIYAGYLDTVGKMRLEFRVYYDGATAAESIDVRLFADVYVLQAVNDPSGSAWTPPSPATSYYTKTETNALITNMVTTAASPTWSDSFTVTIDNLATKNISALSAAESTIDFDSTTTGDIDLWAAWDLTLDASNDIIVGTSNNIYMGGKTMWGDSTTFYSFIDGSVGNARLIGSSPELRVYAPSGSSQYVRIWGNGSGNGHFTSEDISDFYFFSNYSGDTDIDSIQFMSNVERTMLEDGLVYYFWLPDGSTGANSINFGNSTPEDYLRITTSNEPLVFGDGSVTSEGVSTGAGEVIFTEGATFLSDAQFSGSAYFLDTISNSSGSLTVADTLVVTNASAEVQIRSSSGSTPSFEMYESSTKVVDLYQTSSGIYRLAVVPTAGNTGYIEVDTTNGRIALSAADGDYILLIGDNVDSTWDGLYSGQNMKVSGTFESTSGATIGGDLTVSSGGDAVFDGKAAVVTGNSTSEMTMIKTGTGTMSGGQATITFGETFASAPDVVVSYTESSGATTAQTPINTSSITTTNAVAYGDSGCGFTWIAIGQK